MSVSFDLITEPWLPCRMPDGHSGEYSLREALLRAHEFESLRDPSPLVTAALHRLLLAVLHAAYRGPRTHDDWADIWEAGRFDPALIDAYLNARHDRFDLLHPERPFYQTPGFEVNRTAPVAKLAAERACANNNTLFDHTWDGKEAAVSPAEAARYLVATQATALGGGKGAVSNLFGTHPYLEHAPTAGIAVVLLQGGNLFETLALNMVCYSQSRPIPGNSEHPDLPAWDQDPPARLTQRMPRGYLDLLTWQSRCARLIWEADGETARVTGVMLAQGPRLASDEFRVDPMFFRRKIADDTLISGRLDKEKALWRDADALFSTQSTGGRGERPGVFREAAERLDIGCLDRSVPLRSWVLGVANNKAKIELWRHEELPVPTALLRDPECAGRVGVALGKAEETASAVLFSAQCVAVMVRSDEYVKQAEKRQFDWKNVDRNDRNEAQTVVRGWETESRFWADLEPPFREFLLRLPDDPDGALTWWYGVLRDRALAIFNETTRDCHGRSGRELAGRAISEGMLRARLRKLGLLNGKERKEATA